MRWLFSQKGMSLVELLIAASVLVVFSGGLYQIVRSGTRAFKRGDQQIDIQATGRTRLAQLSREIREAKFFDYTYLYVGNDYFFFYMVEPGNASTDLTTYPAVRYYYDSANRRLMRRFWPNDSGGTEGNPDSSPGSYQEEVFLENVVNDVYTSAERIFYVDFSRRVTVRIIMQAPQDKSPTPAPGTAARQDWREARMLTLDVMPRNP